jgi:carboxypeptidase PM20D1
MRKVLTILAGGVFLLVTVVLVRGVLHQPPSLEPVASAEIILDEALIASHLAEAIEFRTISHQRPEDFEAEQFTGFIRWVQTTYPEVHANLDLTLAGGYTMLYRWPGSNPDLQPVLLTAHYDVVPVLPGTESLWKEPPFAGTIANGVVWGRGALDDKSAVIAQLEAVTHLLNAGLAPERTLYFSFGHDEEVGGAEGAGSVVELLAAQNVQLAWSLDEGSFLFIGMLPGIDRLMAAINVAEKGSVTLQVVAKADGGHSSMPPRQTAVGKLAIAIERLEANPLPGGLSGLSLEMFDTASRHMPFTSRLLFANRWLFGGLIEDQLASQNFGNAILRTTTAPTMLSASTKVNVLPIEAIATVNFRVHPRDSVESVVNHVRSVVENPDVEVRIPPGSGRPASRVSDWNSEGFATVSRAIREVYGEVIVTPGLMIAGSDTRHYGKIADNAFRFNPMIVTPEDLTGFHGTNEKISVDNLAQGTRTYIQIIRGAASR